MILKKIKLKTINRYNMNKTKIKIQILLFANTAKKKTKLYNLRNQVFVNFVRNKYIKLEFLINYFILNVLIFIIEK